MEAVVVLGLFLAALTLMRTLFVYGGFLSRSGGERSDLQRSRLKVASLLRLSMAGSYQSGNDAFYLDPGPEPTCLVLSLISRKDSNGNKGWSTLNNAPVFQSYELFFRRASDRTLRTLIIPRAPSEEASPLTRALATQAVSDQRGQVLASNVDAFQMVDPQGAPSNDWMNPLGLRMIQTTTRTSPIRTELQYKFSTL